MSILTLSEPIYHPYASRTTHFWNVKGISFFQTRQRHNHRHQGTKTWNSSFLSYCPYSISIYQISEDSHITILWPNIQVPDPSAIWTLTPRRWPGSFAVYILWLCPPGALYSMHCPFHHKTVYFAVPKGNCVSPLLCGPGLMTPNVGRIPDSSCWPPVNRN